MSKKASKIENENMAEAIEASSIVVEEAPKEKKAKIAIGLWGNRVGTQADEINKAILAMAPKLGDDITLANLAVALPNLSKARLSLHLSYLNNLGFISAQTKGAYKMAILP